MMADMDGWEVYRQLQADAERTIPVIVITAKWEESTGYWVARCPGR
jgi:CheY-like chemotaxis protein